MSKIIIGTAHGKKVGFDIEELLTTRLLVQANSGGGKSWLLRRLAEQLFGKVQTIILDPEGEFFTLREKFGYVLVGEGGETPADVRSAALLAQKFMELKVSAVCDLFEAFRSRPTERRQWVRLFLNALLEVPRSQWSPLIVIIDEAHKFCPQETPKAGSQQEREIIAGCKDAMIALATTGRKRGFCPVWATQRLAKLDKDASAELFNRLVGMTIEDVDVDRAADLMSVSREDKQDFRTSLRTLNPGQFYAFGRAISKVRELITVGDIQTRHPESGKAARYSEPPPMPEAVAKLLPKLADLPKEAEDKARTEAEYKREIRELRMKVKAAERAQASAAPATAGKTVIKADPQQARTIQQLRTALEDAVKIIAKINAIGFEGTDVKPEEISAAIEKAATEVGKLAGQKIAMKRRELEKLQEEVNRLLAKLQARLGDENVQISVDVTKNEPVTVRTAPEPRPIREPASVDGITQSQMKILQAAAEFHAIGIPDVSKKWLAARSGASHKSSAYSNNLGALRSRGLLDYRSGQVFLTPAGLELAVPQQEVLGREQMAASCKNLLTSSQCAIFDALYRAYPNGMNREDLAQAAGASPTSSAFSNNLGAMRSAGMIDYGSDKTVHMQKWIFLENGDEARRA